MKFRTAYDSPMRVDLDASNSHLTEQSHKDSCDINNILARYQRTGVIEHRKEHEGQYAFCSGQDFRESMEIVAKANSMFEQLPSSTRAQFKNSPEIFLDFVQNDKNLEEMYKLGLATRPEKPSVETTPEPKPGDVSTDLT